MNKFAFIFAFIIFALPNSRAQSVDESNAKIGKSLQDYYELDRENIHLQVNKKIFLNNEKVWFKGYIFNRKLGVPFYDTTNIFAVLYDTDGMQIDFKLLQGFNGSFTGFFNLGEALPSGKYNLHVYTNWMNNFVEDESTVVEIHVINPLNNTVSFNPKINYAALTTEFFSEGGNLIRDTNNIVGFKVTDCNGNVVPNLTGNITNDSGNVTHTVQTNAFGLGKFEYIPTNKPSKLQFSHLSKLYESTLPNSVLDGIALEINTIDFDDKITISLKINSNSKTFLENDPIYIVIHQDDKVNILNSAFKNNKKEIIFDYKKDLLFDGINIIRIIDKNLNQIAERIIYNNMVNEVQTFDFKDIIKGKQMYVVHAKSILKKANLSISVVPERSIALEHDQNIITNLKIAPYLQDKRVYKEHFIDAANKWNTIDLDLILLNQKTTGTNWQDLLNNPPQKKYNFEVGLDVSGKVLNDIKPSKYKVQLFSIFENINVFSDISDKREFSFKNLALRDSTALSVSLMQDKEGINPDLMYMATIANNKKQFFKKLQLKTIEKCTEVTKLEAVVLELPKIMDSRVEQLTEVQIINKKKELSRNNFSGNKMLRGFKMDFYGLGYSELLGFIQSRGFSITRGINFKITTDASTRGTGNAARSPEIYFDDRLITDASETQQISIEDVDEIYIDNNKEIGGFNNAFGIIKVYFKANKKSKSNTKENPLKVLGGFERFVEFKNTDYISTTDSGFENFGQINWIPQVITDESGAFKFEIPDTGRSIVKIKIEGFTDDGKLISEIRTIKLK